MTAYDVRISDWSSDVCSSDLHALDQVLVPCSGGGLVSGCALALATLSPETRVHPVEPAGFDDMKRSLAAGRRVANERTTGSFCDALLSREPGELTFAVAGDRKSGV